MCTIRHLAHHYPLVGGILSNKATQEAYDKYSLVGARAVERAQNIAWSTYQQSRQDLAPFRGGGAAAYNQYLTMIGVDPKSLIPSKKDIEAENLRFPGGPPILGAVLDVIDPAKPEPLKPGPVGPVDRNFNPSDYASLYRDVGDAKRSPTEGINQLQRLFWGTRRDALGFGGIMGATLSGQMSLGTANTLGKYLYSRWTEDMKRSGVSQEDFVRSVDSQRAVNDLTNNIVNLENSLDKVLQFRGVSFKWRESDNQDTQYGYIAQEVNEILPELVSKHNVTNNLTIKYINIIPLLSESIKTQQKQIDNLENTVKEQSETIDKLKADIATILEKINK